MIIHNFEQGTPEWFAVRTGKVTASRFKDVLANGRGNAPSKTRQSYMMEVAAEILTGKMAESYSNEFMAWGTECEPLAREFYQEQNFEHIEKVGFIEHADYIGCSPDGLVGDKGLIEIKCPKTTTQMQRVLDDVFPAEYMAQVQGQLWICEREWCDFVSFDPRIKSDAKYFCVRVERDEKYIEQLKKGINDFLTEMLEIIEKLK